MGSLVLLISFEFYWFLLYYHWLVLRGFYLGAGNGLFEPSLLLVIRHILMVHIPFLFIVPYCYWWFLFFFVNGCFLFLNIIIIFGFNNFMELLLEIRRNFINPAHESISKHCGNLIKSSLSILQSKYRHTIITVAAVNAQLTIFITSILNIGKGVINVRSWF